MEDGTKEDPVQQKEPKFLGKAGWLKKAPGRLLASYKERYIHVEKTELVVYEQEDLKNCLERLDLENYDKCLEMRSPFKKKHRLILIRSPKAANKVHDAKFQAQSAEEKEAWIKALSDGINRAKNKVFDEVKVDDSSNLEHVTRTRPKGNRNRRPPTRIHMKEVADVSSDGILRLDLDLEDAVMPNGTYQTDGGERTASLPVLEEEEDVPPKKVIKPPMPPTKEAKASPAPQEEAVKDETPEKKVLKPPMPPSKEAKPCAPPADEASEEAQPEQVSEKSPEAKKKAGPPPTPPNKPGAHSPTANLAEASQPGPNPQPPTPPSKEKKPSQSAAEPDQEHRDSEQEEAREADRADAGAESPDVKGESSEEDSSESESSEVKAESAKEPQVATECLRKSPTPLPRATKRPEIPKTDNPAAATPTPPQPDLPAPDTSPGSLPAEEPESEVPSIIVSLNDPLTDDSLGLSPLLRHSSGGRRRKEEEKSVDSGQHSDDESEGSACEDTLAASTAALRGSHVGLDMLDTSEDDLRAAVILRPAPAASRPQAGRGAPHNNRLSEPTAPLQPAARAKSASSGDLLCGSAAVGARSAQPGAPPDDLVTLKGEVALEMEETGDLLSTVAKLGADGEDTPGELLAQAMEKLQKADHVLREVNKLQIKHSSPDRKSW